MFKLTIGLLVGFISGVVAMATAYAMRDRETLGW